MRRSTNCASAHQNGGFRSSEKIEPKCKLQGDASLGLTVK